MHQIVTVLPEMVFQYHMKMKSLFIFILSTPQTIQSQSMRKLNPMKSPSTPPTSATRELKEWASSSFRTSTGEVFETIKYVFHSLGCLMGSSSICVKRLSLLYNKYDFTLCHTLYSIKVHGIKHSVFSISIFLFLIL